MMKRIALFLAAAACLLAGCSRTQKFTFQGDFDSARITVAADSLLLQSDGLPVPVVIPVKDKSFSFSGEVKKPCLASLKPLVANAPKIYPDLILEKGNITFQDGRAVGTPLNDAIVQFVDRLKGFRTEYPGNPEGLKKAVEDEFVSFVTAHKNDPCATYTILLARGRVSKETLQKLISTASPEVQNVGEIRQLKNELKRKVSE